MIKYYYNIKKNEKKMLQVLASARRYVQCTVRLMHAMCPNLRMQM
jgi:hypothetical protein